MTTTINRREGLHSSDIAAILGVSKWGSPYSVWATKMGLAPEPEMNEAMWEGTVMEGPLRQRYMEETGLQVVKPEQTIVDPKVPYFRTTPDGIIEAVPCLFEVKHMNPHARRFWGEPGTDDIPNDYLFQCLWPLRFEQLSHMKGHRVLAHFSQQTPELYWVNRIDSVLKEIEERAHYFWQEYVVKEQEPPKDGHDATAKAIEYVYRKATCDQMLEATTDVEHMMEQRIQLKKEIEDRELHMHKIDSTLNGLIGTFKGIVGRPGKFVWYNVKGSPKYKDLALQLGATEEMIDATRGEDRRQARFTVNKEQDQGEMPL